MPVAGLRQALAEDTRDILREVNLRRAATDGEHVQIAHHALGWARPRTAGGAEYFCASLVAWIAIFDPKTLT